MKTKMTMIMRTLMTKTILMRMTMKFPSTIYTMIQNARVKHLTAVPAISTHRIGPTRSTKND